MSHIKNEEQQLWEKVIKGNETAFAVIYKRFSYSLMTYGSKICFDENIVKDAIQDVFVHIWNKRYTLPPVTNVKMYLFKSLRNRLYRILEKHPKYQIEIDEDLIVTASEEDSIILSELKREHLLKLHFHLQNLPLRQREVIHLKFFQNLSITEIATLMEINNQSISNHIFKGINTLKSKLRPTNLNLPIKKTGKN